MHVTTVELRNFRSYERAEVELDRGVNLIVGDNGQGKTNFLEAIGLLSVGRSIRGASDGDMVRWDTEHGTVLCKVGDNPATRIEMQLRPGERKQITVDGAALGSLSDLIGMIRTVHMTPDTIDQQFRSPSGRRRMLDVLISQIDRHYLDGLKRHRQIVQNLNSLYKRPDPFDSEMDAWEQQLAATAVDIVAQRVTAVEALNTSAAGRFSELFGGTELELRLRPTLSAEGDDPVADGVAALAESRGGALRCGYVTRGAHRDRLDVLIDGRDMEAHASQGQVKGAYFAWKIAEGDVIADRVGDEPIWLVDDPFSEMDRTRALSLLEVFVNRGQVVLTTARDDDLDLGARGFPAWRVTDGNLVRM